MGVAGSDSAEVRTYAGVHRLLKRHRGSAVGKPCHSPGCTRLADGWGLVGTPTHIGPHPAHGRTVRWSVRLDDYAPLCDSHNAQRDRGGSWTLCPQGHARIAWGVTSTGTCRGCHRESRRRERAAKTAARAAARAGADEPAEGVSG